MSYGQDGSGFGTFGQLFDSAGAPRGGEFQINSFTTETQEFPSAAATGTSQFVVSWDSYAQDGSDWGVFGQRFDFGAATPTVHAGDLDRRAKNVGGNWRAQVKALVHDGGHNPVSGARVTFDVSGVGTVTCKTTAAGDCEVAVVVSDSVPSLTFAVTSLNKDGFGYDAAANHDPDPDSDGTIINVNQP
jgi:hypothetical protein